MIEKTEIFEQWQQDLIEPEVVWIPSAMMAFALFLLGLPLGMWVAS